MKTEGANPYHALASSLNDVLEQADSLELYLVAALIAQALDAMIPTRDF